MNHVPQRRRWSTDTTILLLFLGVAALAAGLSTLVVPSRHTSEVAMKPEDEPMTFQEAAREADLKAARDKASQVQEELLTPRTAPVERPSVLRAEARAAGVAAIPNVAQRHGIEPVKVLDQIRPAYPSAARAARIQGAVEVRVLVDRKGRPAGAKVLSGPAPLREEALQAAQGWRFSPARRNGVPVDSAYLLRFDFRLV
ncbi:MAG TPA: TonB family protein [Holophagaceae bacterium]|nr:TonB family protein [Holophagaceae bacterium]